MQLAAGLRHPPGLGHLSSRGGHPWLSPTGRTCSCSPSLYGGHKKGPFTDSRAAANSLALWPGQWLRDNFLMQGKAIWGSKTRKERGEPPTPIVSSHVSAHANRSTPEAVFKNAAVRPPHSALHSLPRRCLRVPTLLPSWRNGPAQPQVIGEFVP